MSKPCAIVLAAVLPALIGGAATAASGVLKPYAVENSEVREIASHHGDAYRIYVARPDSAAPAAGYPVLYVLDGDDNFAVAAETARRLARFAPRSGMTPGLVVGIAHPNDSQRQRALDFTPPSEEAGDPRGHATGGADRFLDFIMNELKPQLGEIYLVDPARQAIFGHSYGGLFVLHALFTRPDSFTTYIASSPSLWFGDGVILEAEADFARQLTANPRPLKLVLTVGELEQGGPAGNRDSVAANRAMAHRLAGLADAGLRLHHAVFNAANHGTASLPAIGLGLPEAFAPPLQTEDLSR